MLDRCRSLIADRPSPHQWSKSSTNHDAELVTEIDIDVERLLTTAIHERLPNASILSEESSPDPSALGNDTCFVIDPIDGTNELAAGRSGFAISVALYQRGRPAAALLDLPALDQRFECGAGLGTELNGKTVRLSPLGDLAQARIAVSATQRRMDHLQLVWRNMPVAELVPTPAFTPKFAAVLSGRCDAALYLPVRPHRTAIWDYAAAAFLLNEAGGWFGSTDGSDLLREQPFLFADGWMATPPGLRKSTLEGCT